MPLPRVEIPRRLSMAFFAILAIIMVIGSYLFVALLIQRVKRGNANLRLYDYRWPGSVRERQSIATVRTDERGRFDFGTMQEGHYTLVIDWAAEHSDQFDVEIKKLPAETSSVKIDVSPVDPDCTGGHEFVSYSE